MGMRTADSNRKDRLVLLGERGLTILCALGCFGTYVIALTVGMRAFLPTAAALGISLLTLGALAFGFFILGRKVERRSGKSEAAGKVVTISAGKLRQAA
jgi:hypothetical protein